MSSNRSAVVIGMGELGSVFATGLLKSGCPVFPVLRGQHVPETIAGDAPELVLVAVGEDDLDGVLATTSLPAERLVLMQNELLPLTWQRHQLERPNVVVVWFEKKRGRTIHTVLPSVICGPRAETLARCLTAVDVAHRQVEPAELPFELVKKNLYILVHNLCGLLFKGTVEELWNQRPEFAEDIASEVLDLQFARLGRTLDRARLTAELRAAVAADPGHGCAGRTAAARLRRALAQAKHLSVSVPRMISIDEELARD